MADRPQPRQGPMTEADLRAAWVVEPPRLAGKIQVVDYDPEWPRLFQREADRIAAALGERVVQSRPTSRTWRRPGMCWSSGNPTGTSTAASRGPTQE